MRVHPFDVAFGLVADEWFGAIRSAADKLDASDLAQFSKLAPVERILSEMEPEQSGPETAERTDEYLRLLYAGYHFWDTGRRNRDVPREALESENTRFIGGKRPSPSLAGAVYCRLPEHWLWGQVAEGSPHEPLDGFFVVAGPGGDEWIVVAVLGLRADRGGFSQISVTASKGDLVSATSLRQPFFPPVMSGGELAGFHSITSVAELLLLTRLALVSDGQ